METLIALAQKNLPNDELKEFRLNELEHFKKNNWQEVQIDSYQFTRLQSFFSDLNFSEAEEKINEKNFQIEMPTILFINGKLINTSSIPKGISVKEVGVSLIKDRFTKSNPLSHLHHALTSDPVMIEVEKNAQIKTSLRILNILTKSTLTASSKIIVAGPCSNVSFIEETMTIGDKSYACVSETYITANSGSEIEYISLESLNENCFIHSSVFAQVENDANVRSIIFNLSGKMNRKNLNLNLNAQGSYGESYSLFLTGAKEHSDIYTEIHHNAADSTSSQISKGVLSDESRGVFSGLIHIHPNAQRVNSSQLNKNLLLSKKAQIQSCPRLEIFADDVKCSHGSTTGELNQEEIFYFETRGIPFDKARKLLAMGFGLEVVSKIKNKNAHNFIQKIIENKLFEKFSLGKNL